jgi:hypothetical protein
LFPVDIGVTIAVQKVAKGDTHRGNCCVNVTVSTSTVNDWPATNSATSRSAKAGRSRDQETDILKAQTNGKRTQLASLGSVVVSGCPPLASRICKRVSLNSRPGIEVVAGAAAVAASPVDAEGTAATTPSRSAFSCAAFSARWRLSASI